MTKLKKKIFYGPYHHNLLYASNPFKHLYPHLFQIVLDSDVHPLEQVTAIGTSVLLEGVIEKAQTEGKYTIELKADKVLHVGPVNPVKYPLSKPRLSLEAIRVYPHFRARTTTVKFHS